MRIITFISLSLISISLIAQTDKELVESTVSKSKIEGHIYYLADDLLKGRETGTVENKIAASYLANALRGYGVQPVSKTGSYFQSVALKRVSPPQNFMLAINGKEYKKKVVLEAAKLEFKGNVEYLGYGFEDDYKGKNVNKKVILVKSGSPETQDLPASFDLKEKKKELAKKAGAIGIIEFVNAENSVWEYIDHKFNTNRLEVDYGSTPSEDKSNNFVYVWLHDEDRGFANSLNNNEPVNVNLTVTGESTQQISSQNVVGMVEGSDPNLKDEFIIYSAHYDHVGIGTPDENGDIIYNGARDNAVGTTTVLSVAENIAKYPTKRSALFILFTGEEKGLLGSEYYVNNPVLPLDQMVYCFNSDNAGYNDTTLATIIGLNRTTAGHHIMEAAESFGLKAIDDPAPEEDLFNRSDNVNFAKKGIPAPTFSLGFTAFNGTVTEYYHQANDEANTLDYNYLFKFFKSYVLASRKIANDPKTHFWTSGDKYEAAGKALYNR